MNEPYGSGTLLAEVGAEVLSYDVSGGSQYFYVTAVDGEVIPGPAPDPSGHEEEDVISIFSDVFTDLEGTDFNPWWWQSTIVTIEELEGNPTLKYADFNYQGTQFAEAQDLSLMEYMHLDLWTQNEPAVNVFLISQSTGEQAYAMAPLQEEWNSYDIPLSYFTDLGLAINDIHQLKFDGGTHGTIWFDNIYFWKTASTEQTDATLSDLLVDGTTIDGFDSVILNYNIELPNGTEMVPTVTAVTTITGATHVVNAAPELPGVTDVVVTALDGETELTYSIDFSVAFAAPQVAAPTPPVADPDTVLSIYSDAYPNLADTNFNPFWGQSTQVTVDHDVAGDNTLLYEDLNFQGTNLGHADGADQDVSGYSYLHLDFWSPNTPVMNFYLISRTTGERGYALPSTQEEWVSVDIPLSHYSDLGLDLSNIFQFKVHGGDGSVVMYFDNWYFHGDAEVVEDPEPTEAAPIPTYASEDVIPLFSNAYTPNHPVDTWSAGWDQADVTDIQIAGDDVKLYEYLNYAGIEFTSTTVDATAMTHFRLDFWTPDATDLPAVFKIKLVDFGADGVWGGDDVEHELFIDANYSTPLQSETWVTFDLPLTEFPGLTTRGHVAQLIISGDPNTVYIDNVLFHQ
jgi:hypothetical protein